MVDPIDLSLFESAFGTANAAADFNGDAEVDLLDLSLLEGLFGLPPGPSATGQGSGMAAADPVGFGAVAVGDAGPADPPPHPPAAGDHLL